MHNYYLILWLIAVKYVVFEAHDPSSVVTLTTFVLQVCSANFPFSRHTKTEVSQTKMMSLSANRKISFWLIPMTYNGKPNLQVNAKLKMRMVCSPIVIVYQRLVKNLVKCSCFLRGRSSG